MRKNNRVGQKTIVLFLTRFIILTPHQYRGMLIVVNKF